MVMWLRLGGALLATLLVMGCLDYFGVTSVLSGRSAEDLQHEAHVRLRELFWFAIFAAVMATAVLAAARRGAEQLRRSAVSASRRRHVA